MFTNPYKYPFFLSRVASKLTCGKQWYYELTCKIEAVCKWTICKLVSAECANMVVDLSASTQYTLLFNNQRYNSVTAEYV